MDIEQEIKNLIKKAIEKNKKLHLSTGLCEINLDMPKLKQYGDISTNIALMIAQKTGAAPLEIAQQLKQTLDEELNYSSLRGKIEKIAVEGAGFINFFFSLSWLCEVLLEIRKKQEKFGRLKLGRGEKVHLEFVSANPTGPLNVAHGRQAAFGDTLANLLEFCGSRVTREYYLNDEGVQIDLLGDSVYAKYLGLLGITQEFPEAGYRGRYIDVLAQVLVQKYGRRLSKASEKKRASFSSFAYQAILKEIKQDLNAFGVRFDSWFSQRQLNKSGKITRVLELLKKKGFIYQKEGAWWLLSTKFGDDKDRVVIKSDSKLTYIAPDIAYHQNKFTRGFAKMINIWGPDHHGYIPRLKAAVSALGYDAQRVRVLIVQLVSLSQADKVIPMSTRLGQYVTLADIIRAVGKDAARFFFLMRKRDAHLNFDLALAKKQSLENPVYYIQYAHARILNILKFAQADPDRKAGLNKKPSLSLLDKPEEISLLQRLRQFPALIEFCVKNLEPHRMTTYLQELAKAFHVYYERYKVVSEDADLTCARLLLVDAARIVLNNSLRLLAIEAPEKM